MSSQPKTKRRPETGPMRFGDDWTGVFIRGDNAAYYAQNLRMLLELIEKPLDNVNTAGFAKFVVKGLVSDLEGCVHSPGQEPEAQIMKDFEECIDEEEAREPET